MQFTTTWQKGYVLEANATGINTAKKSFFFFNLEKQHGAQKLSLMIRKLQTRHIFYNVKSNSMKLFSKNTKKKPWQKVFSVISIFQNSLKIKKAKFNQKRFIWFSKKQAKDKSPGNDGLTKESYDTFRNELKEIFIDFVSETKEHLSTSQRQAIIRLTDKR